MESEALKDIDFDISLLGFSGLEIGNILDIEPDDYNNSMNSTKSSLLNIVQWRIASVRIEKINIGFENLLFNPFFVFQSNQLILLLCWNSVEKKGDEGKWPVFI